MGLERGEISRYVVMGHRDGGIEGNKALGMWLWSKGRDTIRGARHGECGYGA